LEPSSGNPRGSLVEQLSGKPVELGSALPEGRGSWQAGGCSCLMPGWCLSQQGGAPVIPHEAGARRGLVGVESEGPGSGHPTHSCGSAGPEGWWAWGRVSWRAVGPAPGWVPERPGDRYPSGAWIQRGLRGGYPSVCGSGVGLWPSAA
jgi:hypothetical protein